MSNADWKAEVRRREVVTTDRRNRLNAKRARHRAAAVEQVEASRAGMMNPPGGHAPQAAWSQQSVRSPAIFLSLPQPWGCAPSPGYTGDDAHGGFNPNITFPHGHRASPSSLNPDQRTHSPAFTDVQYPRTPPLCRGALHFSQASSLHFSNPDATEAGMEEIITSGSAAAASPGFQAQDDTTDLAGDMDDELDYGEEEEEPAPAPARKGKRRSGGGGRTGEPRVKWASKEDECLAEAWKTVCLDPITGMNQNADTYWERIKSEFDERKLVDPYFATIHMKRGSKAMANHWAIIQTACNKWHGIAEEIAARPKSGANVESQMVRMFAMYRQDSNTDQEFKYLHVFSRIEKCEKWTDIRRILAKAKETYKPDAPTPGAADGRPDGNKRAKTTKDAAPATEQLHASIEQCIADAKNHAARREEKSEVRWSPLMTNNAVKLDLLRTNVAAKKKNTNPAFLMGADMSTMDEQVKAWYLTERGLILNQMLSTNVPTPTPTPTPPPSPSDDVSTTPSTEAAPTPTSPSMPTPASPTPEEHAAV
ncbi:uncharacterized protein [Aegilops tauschii subsp. strangulata]|uniref:uncharacterized protein n=1 Tax=Aegilops tauschii subsp. strangulata TaxID=200361 RepID=UPI00098A0A20|nr:uncharacterized protein LOC109747585 [Aegilops tauschii subsp. strangulata]